MIVEAQEGAGRLPAQMQCPSGGRRLRPGQRGATRGLTARGCSWARQLIEQATHASC